MSARALIRNTFVGREARVGRASARPRVRGLWGSGPRFSRHMAADVGIAVPAARSLWITACLWLRGSGRGRSPNSCACSTTAAFRRALFGTFSRAPRSIVVLRASRLRNQAEASASSAILIARFSPALCAQLRRTCAIRGKRDHSRDSHLAHLCDRDGCAGCWLRCTTSATFPPGCVRAHALGG